MQWGIVWTSIGLMVVGGGLIFLALLLVSPSPRAEAPSESRYATCFGKDIPLGSVYDEASAAISVIVPAYNESLRLQDMLAEAIDYLTSTDYKECCKSLGARPASELNGSEKPSYADDSWEIIVVDDGSSDKTAQVAIDLFQSLVRANEISPDQAQSCKVVSLQRNRGKGGAVQHGVLHSSGREILYVDADGATRFSDLGKLRTCLADCRHAGLHTGDGIAVGSRAHMVNSEAVVKRSFIRNALMHSFHLLLSVLAISSIADTQCGFKLIARETARKIVPSLHVQGWIFDVELLILAQRAGLKLGYPGKVREVYIHWSEKEGSKIDLVWDSLRMLRDLLIIRLNYLLGRWSLLPEYESRKDHCE